MRNQPRYNFFRNTKYAINGLKDLVSTETSFKIELIIAFMLFFVIIYIDTSMINKILMFITLIGVLIAEAINSAIERVVDLVTIEYNDMAGRAKDIGSAVVFLSIFVCVIVWCVIIYSQS